MTILIRPHHFLCMLTFMGKGYSAAFVKNYAKIVERLNSGEDIKIVDGPDDICKPMLHEPDHHCHNDSVKARDIAAAGKISEVLQVDLASVRQLSLPRSQVNTLRRAYEDGVFRVACNGCQWQELCASIAARDYRGCHLDPGQEPNSG